MAATQVWIISFRWTVQNMCGDDLTASGGKLCKSTDAAKNDLVTWLETDAKAWCFQLEDTKDNLHFQGYANLNEKIRPKTLAKALNDTFKGIEVQACSNAGKRELQKYCMKADTRVAGPWADRKIYMGQDLMPKLFKWQEKLKNYLLGEVNDREILWIVDEQGCSGKSKFCKYMSFHHKTLKLTYGDAKDLLNLVSKNPCRSAYLFDLTRTKPQAFSTQDLYSAIESVKDGHFINTKYETEEVMMSIPHVVVFSNQWPNRENMSDDRWNVQPLIFSGARDGTKVAARKRFEFHGV